MKFASVLFLATVTLTTGAQNAAMSSSVERCARSDPNFLECFRINFENGIRRYALGDPFLKLDKFEPFRLNTTTNVDVNGGSANLVQKYDNMYIYGTSGSTVVKADANFGDASPYMNLEVFSPIIEMTSDYDIRGNFFIFPINGHGKCNITMYELTAKHTSKLTKESKDGKTYLKIVDYAVELTPKRIEFNYENVFPGDSRMNDEIVKRINENALASYEMSLKKSFEMAFAGIWKQTANKFFEKLPESDLFLD